MIKKLLVTSLFLAAGCSQNTPPPETNDEVSNVEAKPLEKQAYTFIKITQPQSRDITPTDSVKSLCDNQQSHDHIYLLLEQFLGPASQCTGIEVPHDWPGEFVSLTHFWDNGSFLNFENMPAGITVYNAAIAEDTNISVSAVMEKSGLTGMDWETDLNPEPNHFEFTTKIADNIFYRLETDDNGWVRMLSFSRAH